MSAKKYAAFILIIISAGCSQTYNRRMMPVKTSLKTGAPENALEYFKETEISKEHRNRLLYHLEAGMLYHLAGKYERSNYFLERAEWISDEMYTRSISREAASMLTSDDFLPYRGEYYDYLFINYYKLLNFLHLGELEGALVEVRRLNHKLSLFDRKAGLFHYITALLHMHSGNESGAFIEFRKAWLAYSEKYSEKYNFSFPETLRRDLGVFCKETGFSRCSEIPSQYRAAPELSDSYGSVVFIVESGFAPYKEERRIEASLPQEYRDRHEELKNVYYLKIALPELVLNAESYEMKLRVGHKSLNMDLIENVDKMVENHFEEEKNNIIARAVARAAAKYLTYRSVRGGESEEGSFRNILASVFNIFGTVTEQADTRSWITLPSRIFMNHLYLEPGEYDFEITTENSTPKSRRIEGDFKLNSGEMKFVVLRTY